MLSGRPGLTVDQLVVVLTTGAVDLGPVGPDETYGTGRVDAVAAWMALT